MGKKNFKKRKKDEDAIEQDVNEVVSFGINQSGELMQQNELQAIGDVDEHQIKTALIFKKDFKKEKE